ncbi:hypothetical protein PanWU01x14_061200 [Parasponia andersonii]|uniref:Uncharacterized protein n=1 Tax=Parasponia andersonii TaxID=3476 RepID=A0A2P5DI91_PARAD|nr:hypothetical protein PanWU01x14_061200 [Parasponia andersonii]
MEEEAKKQQRQQQQQPSFPSNYVTLVQLQERWLRDKQRKQQQQEEVIQKTESEIVQGHGDGADRVGEGGEEAEKKNKKKKKKKKSKNKYKEGEGKRAEVKEGVVVHALMSHGEKQGPKERRNEKSRGARAKSRAEEVVVHALLANGEKGEEGVSERRKNRKGREIRAEINDLDRTAPIEPTPRASSKKAYVRVEKEIQAPLANGEKEKEKVSGRRDRGRRGVRGDTRGEGTNLDQTAHSEPEFRAKEVVPGKQVVVQAPLTNCEKEKSGETTGESNETADIEPKFGGLAVNGGIGGNDDGLRRTRAYHNGSHRRRSGYGKQGSREVRNSKDARMVWVKKEEVFDANVCGAQKSGSSAAVSG